MPPEISTQFLKKQDDRIVGIDPGLSGALFFLDSQQPTSGEAVDFPVHLLQRGGKAKREIDIAGLVGLLSRPLNHAFVERAGAMPGQGTASMFAFGKCFGLVLGVLAALAIPTTLVAPVTWKRALQLPKGKHAARARASQLLPGAAHQWRLVGHHNRAEAALLALYGSRSSLGLRAPSETAKVAPSAAQRPVLKEVL